jgi:hypothetical protein
MTEREYPFRFAERCLYDYLENVARLEVLRTDLRMLDAASSVKVQNYDGVPGSGYPSDSVSGRLQRIEKVEEDILHLERRTLPIRRLYNDLRENYVLADSPKMILRGILELFYLGENTWQATAEELGLSRMSFFRRRNELVALSLRYLGF